MHSDPQIAAFLGGDHFAVVGASTDRSKYGNKVLRTYQQQKRDVTPVNPKAEVVEGIPAAASLSDIKRPIHGISVITPPAVTESVVQEAIRLGIQHIWMQPGAEERRRRACGRKRGDQCHSQRTVPAGGAGLSRCRLTPCVCV